MTTHHSVRIYANYGAEDHGRRIVTGYMLRHSEKPHTESYTVWVDNPDTRGAALRSLCKLLRGGWFITNIFYSETPP